MNPPTWSGSPDTWWTLFSHFLALSLMSIGGAITLVPDMHRRLVVQDSLLTDEQFTSAVALAQAAPGPNVLFVALMGWYGGGIVGAVVSMLGIMLPSATLTLLVARWVAVHRTNLYVRAFQGGMTPVTVGLLLATGWLLTPAATDLPGLTLAAVVAGIVWRTKVSLIWLVLAGAVLGALGWV
jgi:chromate transporter